MDWLKKLYWKWLERYHDYAKRKNFIRIHYGDKYTCNLCGWSGSKWYEKQMGVNTISKVCPKCDSKPRQRILKVALEQGDFIVPSARIVHVSPQGERGIATWLRSIKVNFLSIDIQPGKAMKVMDLTQLDFPNNTIDVVVCCHVLEHIENDIMAIKEIYRVLRNNGVAIFQVPIYGEITKKVQTPAKHDHFHVWHPGFDYSKRYEQIGFKVSSIGPNDINGDIVHKLSLIPEDRVDVCMKVEQLN